MLIKKLIIVAACIIVSACSHTSTMDDLQLHFKNQTIKAPVSYAFDNLEALQLKQSGTGLFCGLHDYQVNGQTALQNAVGAMLAATFKGKPVLSETALKTTPYLLFKVEKFAHGLSFFEVSADASITLSLSVVVMIDGKSIFKAVVNSARANSEYAGNCDIGSVVLEESLTDAVKDVVMQMQQIILKNPDLQALNLI